jgi:hypothetical protein
MTCLDHVTGGDESDIPGIGNRITEIYNRADKISVMWGIEHKPPVKIIKMPPYR